MDITGSMSVAAIAAAGQEGGVQAARQALEVQKMEGQAATELITKSAVQPVEKKGSMIDLFA